MTAVIAKVSSWRKQDLDLAVIDVLSARRPKFVYFCDYASRPGKVSIPHLIEARDEGDLTRGEEAVLALLSMAGVDGLGASTGRRPGRTSVVAVRNRALN